MYTCTGTLTTLKIVIINNNCTIIYNAKLWTELCVLLKLLYNSHDDDDNAMAKLSSLAVLVKRVRAVTVHVPAEEWRLHNHNNNYYCHSSTCTRVIIMKARSLACVYIYMYMSL